jgi:RNA polymerase sigma factor (sigma-70 family)
MGAVRPLREHQDASDEELMHHLAAGQQEALGPLYSRYAPLVFNLAAKSLDHAAAEEIVQDVLLSVWRGAASFDPERGAVRPWLLQIAHFRIINELRARSRSPRVDPDPEGLRLVELPDPAPDPAELAWREEHREAVRLALAALPPPQRQALGLAFFGDLTYEQVASALNLPLGTAKTRIRAGLQKLRASLAVLVAAAALALGGLLGVLGARYHAERVARGRDERALRLVTASDASVFRLTALPGVPGETHGNYRGRAGDSIAVLTLSHLPPPPAGRMYQAWARHGDSWTSLGTVRPDGTGSAMLVVDGPALAALPDAVQVTLEPAGGSPEPRGPVVLSWPGQ